MYKNFNNLFRNYFLVLILGVICLILWIQQGQLPWQQNSAQGLRTRVQGGIKKMEKKTPIKFEAKLEVVENAQRDATKMPTPQAQEKDESKDATKMPTKKTPLIQIEEKDATKSATIKTPTLQAQETPPAQKGENDAQKELTPFVQKTPSPQPEEKEDAMAYDMKSRQKKFQVLAQKYAINNTLIVAVTDLGYVEMALNLYESSFKRFSIGNYLFVCSHEKAEQYLVSRNIHALSLWNDSLSTQESLYSGKGYRNKTNFKTDAVLMTLNLGINAFLVDVDLVFLKNPLPYLSQFETTHDLVIQGGLSTLNSGCYLATNRGPAEELHKRMIDRRDHPRKAGGGNQIDMNHIMRGEMLGQINVHVLDRDLFPWGSYYFYMGHREFSTDNVTTEAYAVHNNVFYQYDYGAGAKRYKFREFLMWYVDNDGYYSDPSRKYVTFEYPPHFTDGSEQKEVLLSAFELVHALNRTLILPAFNCPKLETKHCNYQRLFRKTPFFLDIIEGQYREHMFLQHPKVPESIKLSQSEKINFKQLIQKYSRNTFTNEDIPILKDYLSEYTKFAVINLEDFHLLRIRTKSGVREKLAGM